MTQEKLPHRKELCLQSEVKYIFYLFLFQYHHNLLYLSLFTFVCLISRQYNYAFHELRMQLENQVVQIQIQS